MSHSGSLRIVTIAISLLSGLGQAQAESPPQTVLAERVERLLASRCLNCHSGDDAKAKLDLTRQQTALTGGDSGPSLVVGSPKESLVWQRVHDGDMPPDHPLPEDEKELLRQWIKAGASWPTDAIDPLKFTTANRAGYDWWSWQPLAAVEVPEIDDGNWSRTTIDRFLWQELAERQLTPSAAASPRTLIRRLYVDLLGLPPGPEAVDAFEANPSDEAYEAIVDELLASPHYGERWGRHWLDVARFGESNGFERNDPRDSFWPYRDWVIEALNSDMPFDEFARRQIAGDLTVGGIEGAAAVGFLVAGVHNTTVGNSDRMKRLARQDELEEIAGAVGQAFLGLTINCARCHDHKFDPIRTEEYYRFIAALDGVQHGEREEFSPQDALQLAVLREKESQLSAQIRDLQTTARGRLLASLPSKASNPTTAAPVPVAGWDFETRLTDTSGRITGTAAGTARVDAGALILDGKESFVATAPLEIELIEKTLEVWVQLDSLDQQGGAAMSIETPDGSVFDAIVFGERELRRWMAGSNNFARTQSFSGQEEPSAHQEPVHFAIVYQADGTIAAYRNGTAYGSSYQTDRATFSPGQFRVLFGLRHSPPGGNRHLAGRILHANLYAKALSPEAVAASAQAGPATFDEESLRNALTSGERERFLAVTRNHEDTLEQIRRLEENERDFYSVTPVDPPEMQVHIRGGVTDLGKVVSPGGVASITGGSADFGLPPTANDRERRLKLAEWMTGSASPLFSRVIVNRLWQHHFGSGLVETPSDFGFNGGRPSHPKLLEWLAGELQRNGYRLKPLHKLIVTSSAYRQASSIRPEAMRQDASNRLLWRYPPRRVDAETLRDSMLQVAGVLDPKAGGPGYRDVTLNALNGTTYYEPIESDLLEFRRRTIYRFVPRGGISAILDTYDCPDPSVTAPQRNVTTTPLQALSLLNSSFTLAMAGHLSDRVRLEAGDDAGEQVRRAWTICLCRLPDAEEERLSVELVRQQGLEALARGLFNTNEFVVIE